MSVCYARPLQPLAEMHSVLLLFLLCAYENMPGLGENIGDQTMRYGLATHIVPFLYLQTLNALV